MISMVEVRQRDFNPSIWKGSRNDRNRVRPSHLTRAIFGPSKWPVAEVCAGHKWPA